MLRDKMMTSQSNSNFSSTSTANWNRQEQLMSQFYSKVAQVIVQSRINCATSKANKWFNLQINESEFLKDELRFWKAQASSSPQPLILDIYLELSALNSRHLFLKTRERRIKIDREHLEFLGADGSIVHKKTILLESWQLTSSLLSSVPVLSEDLPPIYKKCVIFFRSLYSLTKLLPCATLVHKIIPKSGITMKYRLSTSRIHPIHEIGFNDLGSTSEFNFGSIPNPYGMFNLHIIYRNECQFEIEEKLPTEVAEEFFPRRIVSNENIVRQNSYTSLAAHGLKRTISVRRIPDYSSSPSSSRIPSQRSFLSLDRQKNFSISSSFKQQIKEHGHFSIGNSPQENEPMIGASTQNTEGILSISRLSLKTNLNLSHDMNPTADPKELGHLNNSGLERSNVQLIRRTTHKLSGTLQSSLSSQNISSSVFTPSAIYETPLGTPPISKISYSTEINTHMGEKDDLESFISDIEQRRRTFAGKGESSAIFTMSEEDCQPVKTAAKKSDNLTNEMLLSKFESFRVLEVYTEEGGLAAPQTNYRNSRSDEGDNNNPSISHVKESSAISEEGYDKEKRLEDLMFEIGI